MNTKKIDNKSTLMIAHRGLSGLETENTMPAFIAACNRSYWGCECDIHFTKDHKMVVCHDGHIRRVSKYHDNIANHTYKSLNSKCLNDPFTKEPRDYYHVPLLTDLLDCIKKYEKKLVIELKDHWNESEIKEFHDLLKEKEMLDNVVVISFLMDDLLKLRKIDKDLPIQFLIGSSYQEHLETCFANNFGLDINHLSLSKELIDLFHSHNLPVNAWTVNDPEKAKQYVEWGIDYITTNIVEGNK